MKIRWGWIRDLPDKRDYKYKAIAPKKSLPTRVDLRSSCSKIENQLSLGSCTAQALAANIEMLEIKNKTYFIDASRLFIYYNERALEGSINEDAGAIIRDGIKTLAKKGRCDEKLWPYIIKKFTHKPPRNCYKDAKKRRITSYYRINNIQEMLQCLADGYPVVFGFTVYESLMSPKVMKTGILDMPKPEETTQGGHAVTACGYDMKSKRFIIRNSWGESFGQKGYFTMPFKYIETLSADFWTIRK